VAAAAPLGFPNALSPKSVKRRLSRPKITEGDLRDLIEKELGACDSQMVRHACPQ
jgi:hypothetical protein